jgi:hypothetical protein
MTLQRWLHLLQTILSQPTRLQTILLHPHPLLHLHRPHLRMTKSLGDKIKDTRRIRVGNNAAGVRRGAIQTGKL